MATPPHSDVRFWKLVVSVLHDRLFCRLPLQPPALNARRLFEIEMGERPLDLFIVPAPRTLDLHDFALDSAPLDGREIGVQIELAQFPAQPIYQRLLCQNGQDPLVNFAVERTRFRKAEIRLFGELLDLRDLALDFRLP